MYCWKMELFSGDIFLELILRHMAKLVRLICKKIKKLEFTRLIVNHFFKILFRLEFRLKFYFNFLIVFQTGMVGYPESLTDPSYHSQILVLTYPLIGNYGVPELVNDKYGIPTKFESHRIWAAGLVVGEYCDTPSHWESVRSLSEWMKAEKIPGISGIDTRQLTKLLRENGSTLGKICIGLPPEDPLNLCLSMKDPNQENLVKEVSITHPKVYNEGGFPRICAVDCGLKNNQLRCFIKRGACVEVVPWNYKFDINNFDGLFLSNGPGNPEMCKEVINNLKSILNSHIVKPIFGICLGHQLLATAIGCNTYKMK